MFGIKYSDIRIIVYGIIPRDATHIEQTISTFKLGDGFKKSAEKMNRVKRRIAFQKSVNILFHGSLMDPWFT